MDKDLLNAIESIMQKSLQPIHVELKQMNNRMDNFEVIQNDMLNRLGNVEIELKDFRVEMKTSLRIIQDGQRGTRQEMTQRFNEIKRSLNHLESDVSLIYQKTT